MVIVQLPLSIAAVFSLATYLAFPLFEVCFFLSASIFTSSNQPLWFHTKASISEIFLAVNSTYFLADVSFMTLKH